jgi:hypothetical protein
MHPQPFPRKPMTKGKPIGRFRFTGVLALPAPYSSRNDHLLFVIRDPSFVMSARRPSALKDSIA